jgi:perosamine synthetase
VSDIPGPVDCVLTVIPAAATLEALRECAAKGVRAAIIGVLHRQDIGAANYYPACSLLPQVRQSVGTEPGEFPVAERAAARTIALPFFNAMTDDQVETVCDVLEVALSRTGGASRA